MDWVEMLMNSPDILERMEPNMKQACLSLPTQEGRWTIAKGRRSLCSEVYKGIVSIL